ncbi:MAG: tetratricopeptide repeat protein [Saprospiraceae bacterium]|nr:tetratricopeptide repeat protein [Saprospiraceae bacterium]MBP7679541.1 tetratricopeptide repeat protein [Saprospiraceae bacterium]
MNSLVFEYEAMSQKGTVAFFEKTAFWQIINHYEKVKNFDKCIEVLNIATQQHNFCSEFFQHKASLLLRSNRLDEALQALTTAEALSPNDSELQHLRIEILTAMHCFEEALALANQKIGSLGTADESDFQAHTANIYEHVGAFDEMFDDLAETLLLNGENTEALEKIGVATEFSGRYEDSIILHKTLLDNHPYSYLAWYNLGTAYARIEQHNKAVEAYEFAMVITGKNEFAFRDCAESYIQIKNYAKALRCYEELLEHHDVDSDLLMRIGFCYEQLQQYKLAKAFYAKALQFDDGNAEAHYLLGQMLFHDNALESAATSYRRAIEYDDRNEKYHVALANVCYQMGDLEAAEAAYWKATEVAPDEYSCWLALADFLYNNKRSNDAIEVLDEGYAYACAVELLYTKIMYQFANGKRKEALLALQEVLLDDFDTHTALFEMAPELRQDADVLATIAAYQEG